MSINTKEKLAIWLADHLPARVVYHCFIKVSAHAMSPSYGETNIENGGVTIHDAAGRWCKSKGLEL